MQPQNVTQQRQIPFEKNVKIVERAPFLHHAVWPKIEEMGQSIQGLLRKIGEFSTYFLDDQQFYVRYRRGNFVAKLRETIEELKEKNPQKFFEIKVELVKLILQFGRRETALRLYQL